MRVLFDAFWWDDGPLANRTVQREFIRAWARSFPGDEITLAVRRSSAGAGIPSGASVVRTRLWPHALANRFEIPRLARQVHADVAIVHNYTPWRGESVTFVHDAMFVDHREWFSFAERLYFSPMLPWTRDASIVATSTQSEASRIARLTDERAQPVVTGLGVAPALAEAIARRPAALPDVDGFALTVGRLNVRKNLGRILDAAATSSRITARTPLVVVGTTAHSGVNAEFSPAVEEAVADGRVILLGGVDDAELAWLYGATALAITLSLDEGFGLPATEAAHFDAPLLASDIAVFRETVGDYARFVAADAAADVIGEAIDAAWGGRVDGSSVRARYSWDAAVDALRAAAAQRVTPRASRT